MISHSVTLHFRFLAISRCMYSLGTFLSKIIHTFIDPLSPSLLSVNFFYVNIQYNICYIFRIGEWIRSIIQSKYLFSLEHFCLTDSWKQLAVEESRGYLIGTSVMTKLFIGTSVMTKLFIGTSVMTELSDRNVSDDRVI